LKINRHTGSGNQWTRIARHSSVLRCQFPCGGYVLRYWLSRDGTIKPNDPGGCRGREPAVG